MKPKILAVAIGLFIAGSLVVATANAHSGAKVVVKERMEQMGCLKDALAVDDNVS